MFSRVRGYLALLTVAALLIVAEVLMRFGLVPLGRIFPKHRRRLRAKWSLAMASLSLGPFRSLRVISMEPPPRIPGEAGTLVVMNHQSLFDIPILLLAVQDNFIRIVTRSRYVDRYIPVVTQMVRIYEFPIVNPGGDRRVMRANLKEIRRAAARNDAPLAIFPEGTRTRNGAIGEFQTAGLSVILRSRPWSVHVLVVDGLWQFAKLANLVASPTSVRARVEHAGVLEWSDPRADPAPLLNEIRRRMNETLVAMRRAN